MFARFLALVASLHLALAGGVSAGEIRQFPVSSALSETPLVAENTETDQCLEGILSPGALLDGFGPSLVSASLSVIQNGGSFGDALAGSFGSFLASQGMAALQNGIGDLTLNGLKEGSLGHVLLHGTVGCAFAEVSGGDCRAGFAAGAAASLYSGTLDINDPNFDRTATLNTAELLGAFAGFVFSSGKGENVSLAGSVSQSAVDNNYLTHAQWDTFLTILERCGDDQTCIEAANSLYFSLSAANTAAMLKCGNDLECLLPHLTALLELHGDEELAARARTLAGLIGEGIWDIERIDRAHVFTDPGLAWGYGFSAYSATNCAALDGAQCLANWQEGPMRDQALQKGFKEAALGAGLSAGSRLRQVLSSH